MALPLISPEQLVAAIKTALNPYSTCVGVEIFTEFPADMTSARHGIYINDPTTADRSPYSLAVNYGGNIYIASDAIKIIVVSFQGDKLLDTISTVLQSLVEDNVLCDGYHERDYTIRQEYLNRAEYRTFDYLLKRLEFQ